MSQPRVLSALEAGLNVAAGFGVALAAQIVLFPLVGVEASLGQNLWLALAFTAISLLRSYVLRRLFDRLERRRP